MAKFKNYCGIGHVTIGYETAQCPICSFMSSIESALSENISEKVRMKSSMQQPQVENQAIALIKKIPAYIEKNKLYRWYNENLEQINEIIAQ
jgi:hypothetical protein